MDSTDQRPFCVSSPRRGARSHGWSRSRRWARAVFGRPTAFDWNEIRQGLSHPNDEARTLRSLTEVRETSGRIRAVRATALGGCMGRSVGRNAKRQQNPRSKGFFAGIRSLRLWKTTVTSEPWGDYGSWRTNQEFHMNNIIYIVGLIVVIGAVLAFFGLRWASQKR